MADDKDTTYFHGSYRATDATTGDFRVYTNFEMGEITKALDIDVVGFEINKGDYVWYVDGYNDALKIGEVIGKTKVSARVRSLVSSVAQSERNVARSRVYKLDPDYLKSLKRNPEGFILPDGHTNGSVIDIAGNVLTEGDSVIFSNRSLGGFSFGYIYDINSADKIKVSSIDNAFTCSDWAAWRGSFNNRMVDSQGYAAATPSSSSEIRSHDRVARSSNILKITTVPNGDAKDLHGLPRLLALAKLQNLLVEDDYKCNEEYVFEAKSTYNSPSDKIPHVENGITMEIVDKGALSFKRFEVKQVPLAPMKTIRIYI